MLKSERPSVQALAKRAQERGTEFTYTGKQILYFFASEEA